MVVLGTFIADRVSLAIRHRPLGGKADRGSHNLISRPTRESYTVVLERSRMYPARDGLHDGPTGMERGRSVGKIPQSNRVGYIGVCRRMAAVPPAHQPTRVARLRGPCA